MLAGLESWGLLDDTSRRRGAPGYEEHINLAPTGFQLLLWQGCRRLVRCWKVLGEEMQRLTESDDG